MSELVLLGFVADHHRNIKSGAEYDKYFPAAAGDEKRITNNGTVSDTVKAMEKIVHDTLVDTIKIAPLLKANTLADTCLNVWNFIYNHIQYKNDRPGVEELRRPRRSWAERTTGVDCDCMSLFAGSILANLGIDFKFRITKYTAGWQHVYVIVPLPTDRTKFYVIDCVLDKFNYEKPFTAKFDHTMTSTLSGIPISMLGNVGNATAEYSEELNAILNGTHFEQVENLLGATDDMAKPMLDSILAHITASRDYIRKNPDSVTITGGATNHLKMLDYAIANWNNPEAREKALDVLAAEEERWNNTTPGVSGIADTEIDEALLGDVTLELGEFADELGDLANLGDLGKLKGKGKQFFSNIKKTVKKVETFNKKVATKIIGEKAVDKIQKFKDKAKEVAKKGFAVLKKILVVTNPLAIASRFGFLVAMRVNLFKYAQSLYPALLSEAEAAKHGITADAWNKSKDALEKAATIFTKLGGKRSKLEKNIRNGRAKRRYAGNALAGIDELGVAGYDDAIEIIAAATPLIALASKLKKSGVKQSDYDKKKTVPKQGVRGLGDDAADTTMPEQEIVDVNADGSVDESKKGIAKFIQAIKKWFSRKNNQSTPDEQTAIETEKATDGDDAKSAAEVQVKAEEAQAAVIAAGGTQAEAEEAYNEVVKADGGGDGFFSKIKRFAKENPGKTTAIGLVSLTAISLCIAPLRNAMLSPFKRKTNRPFSKHALSGTGSKKKSTKKTAHKKPSQGAAHVKRVVLK